MKSHFISIYLSHYLFVCHPVHLDTESNEGKEADNTDIRLYSC